MGSTVKVLRRGFWPAHALPVTFTSVAEDGGVTEPAVWRVPQRVPPRGHGCLYRTVYAVDGVRVIGSDNKQGKSPITATCLGGSCPASSPQWTPWWAISSLP